MKMQNKASNDIVGQRTDSCKETFPSRAKNMDCGLVENSVSVKKYFGNYIFFRIFIIPLNISNVS